jgi:hypothetical protein
MILKRNRLFTQEANMRKIIISAGVIVLIALAVFLFSAMGQDISDENRADMRLLASESDGENRREITAPQGISGVDSPDVSFITSSNPYCYQPNPDEDVCYINFRYTYVSSAPATYMRYLTIEIGDDLRANYRSFFDDSITVLYAMQGPGFKVSCGAAGDNLAEDENFGKQYSYTIRAEDSNEAKSANYGSLLCPPFLP